MKMPKLLYVAVFFFCFLSRTFGQFGPEQIVYHNAAFFNYTWGDVDQDGDLDWITEYSIPNTDVGSPVLIRQYDPDRFENIEYLLPDLEKAFEPLLADVNQDGYLDLLLTHLNQNGPKLMTLRLGQPDGSLGAEEVLVQGTNDTTLKKVLDLEGDGDQEILYKQISQVWKLPIDANGNIGAPTLLMNGEVTFYWQEFLDLDNDGHLDLLTFSSLGAKWSKGQNGDFGPLQTILGEEPGMVQVLPIDADGDNDYDLALMRTNPPSIQLMEHLDGQGTFADPVDIVTNISGPFNGQVLDFNGDGALDILYRYWNPLDDGIGVLLNDGNSLSFTAAPNYRPDIGPVEWLEAANLDEDPALELIVSTHNNRRVRWLDPLDAAWQNVEEHPIVGGVGEVSTYRVEDLNEDGTKDILVSDQDAVRIMEHRDGQGLFLMPFTVDEQPTGDYLTVQEWDWDGDDDLDIVAVHEGLGLVWIENEGYPQFSSPQNIFDTTFLDFAQLVDMEGDGDLDLVAVLAEPQSLVWVENENGQFGNLSTIISTLQIGSGNFSGFFVVEDLDNDGDQEVMHWPRGEGQVDLYVNEGSSFSAPILLFETGPFDATHIAAGDINGDGTKDLAVYKTPDSKVLWAPLHADDWSLGNPQVLLNDSGQEFNRMFVQDMDNNGTLDIIGVRFTGLIYLFRNYSSFFAPYEIINDETIAGIGGHQRAFITDLDGDYINDVIGQRYGVQWFKGESFASLISGKTYWDDNENQQLDGGEIGIQDQVVSIDPGAVNAWTNNQGNYFFVVAPGNYDLSLTSGALWQPTTPNTAALQINQSPVSVNFGLQSIDDIYEGYSDIQSAPTRCGFRVPFWLTYKNSGTLFADGTLTLEIDSLAIFVEANPVPDQIDGNVLTWNFENLPPTYSGQIVIDLEMPPVDFLGSPVTFSSNLELAEPGTTNVVFTATEVEYESIINCAYDPNDKLVSPSFVDYDNYTLFGDTLEYTVRFQNTGTDTAFTVRIEDQLAPALDWSTFTPRTSSHPMSVELREDGRAIFLFENILLPDSTTNEPASHGFVKFRIVPKNGLPEETSIENWAGIYFDFNPPIITNTVTNIMVSEFPIVAELVNPTCFGDENGKIRLLVYSDTLTYTWSTGELGLEIDNLSAGDYGLTVTDISETIVADTVFILTDGVIFFSTNTIPPTGGQANGSIEITDISGGVSPYTVIWDTDPEQTGLIATGLAAGTYSATISDADGCTWTPEFILEESTGLPAIHLGNPVKIYPNPASEVLHLEWQGVNQPNGLVDLMSNDGKILQSTTLLKSLSLSVEKLPTGVFYLRVKTEDGAWVEKICIE